MTKGLNLLSTYGLALKKSNCCWMSTVVQEHLENWPVIRNMKWLITGAGLMEGYWGLLDFDNWRLVGYIESCYPSLRCMGMGYHPRCLQEILGMAKTVGDSIFRGFDRV